MKQSIELRRKAVYEMSEKTRRQLESAQAELIAAKASGEPQSEIDRLSWRVRLAAWEHSSSESNPDSDSDSVTAIDIQNWIEGFFVGIFVMFLSQIFAGSTFGKIIFGTGLFLAGSSVLLFLIRGFKIIIGVIIIYGLYKLYVFFFS